MRFKTHNHPACGFCRRRGAVLIVVMMCLLLISLIGASLLKLAVAQHKQTQYRQRQIQAEWLANSALERAVAKLRQNADYAGETWTVEEEILGALGVVRITIEQSDQQPGQRVLSVVAEFPAGIEHRSQVSKRLVIDTAKGETN